MLHFLGYGSPPVARVPGEVTVKSQGTCVLEGEVEGGRAALTRRPLSTCRTLAAGDGRPAFAAAAARGPAHSLGRAAAGAARGGAEPRATASVSDALPPSVPRLARRGGRAHRVAAAACPRPQRGGPRSLRGGPALPAQQRGRGRVPALRPGALLPESAPRPQPHLQLLRRAWVPGARASSRGGKKETKRMCGLGTPGEVE